MKKHLLLFGLLFLSLYGFAQTNVTWVGGTAGVETDWGTAANWDTGTVPAAGDTVIIDKNVTLTGTAIANPAKLSIEGNVITLDLDLTIVGDTDGIRVSAGSILNLGVDGGTGRTFNITNNNDASPSEDAIVLRPGISGDETKVNINTGSTVNITLDAAAGTGKRAFEIFDFAIVQNKGSININEGGNISQTIRIKGAASEFKNRVGSTLNVGDGRIRIEDGGLILNEGLIVKDSDAAAVFVNGTGTTTNRAFFKYGSTSTSNFSNTSGLNNGVNLNATQDAGGMMFIDLGNTSYAYSHGGSAYATSDNTGLLTLPIAGLTTFPDAVLTIDAYPGCSLTITNANNDAYLNPLPIELLSFNADLMDENSVMVKWITISELDNDYMVVEHSLDGQDFNEIGRVIGAGTSSEFNRYEIEHSAPKVGFNYYRLRQVDFNGTVDFSEIVSVEVGRNTNATPVLIYPNIVSSDAEINIDISNSEPSKVTIEILNMNGQILKKYSELSGSLISLQTGSFNNGMYIIRISGQEYPTQIGRFIKK